VPAEGSVLREADPDLVRGPRGVREPLPVGGGARWPAGRADPRTGPRSRPAGSCSH